MSSLIGLLNEVSQLPRGELRPAATEKDRPNEMALLERVLPRDSVCQWRHYFGVEVVRSCYLEEGRFPRILFLIKNGDLHRVEIKARMQGTIVTDNGQVLDISTVTELREYIAKLAETKYKIE